MTENTLFLTAVFRQLACQVSGGKFLNLKLRTRGAVFHALARRPPLPMGGGTSGFQCFLEFFSIEEAPGDAAERLRLEEGEEEEEEEQGLRSPGKVGAAKRPLTGIPGRWWDSWEPEGRSPREIFLRPT